MRWHGYRFLIISDKLAKQKIFRIVPDNYAGFYNCFIYFVILFNTEFSSQRFDCLFCEIFFSMYFNFEIKPSNDRLYHVLHISCSNMFLCCRLTRKIVYIAFFLSYPFRFFPDALYDILLQLYHFLYLKI